MNAAQKLVGVGQPAVPVLADKFARGWPQYPHGKRACYMPVGGAFVVTHTTDAHFAAYAYPDLDRRLAGDRVFEEISKLGGAVEMVLFVVDVDDEAAKKLGVPAREDWWTGEREKLDRLLAKHPGAFVYRTKGGYRIVYVLTEPAVLRGSDDAKRWKATYLAWLEYVRREFAIVGDVACQDWTRLYRLPRVVRDGKSTTHETIGDPASIGLWDVEVVIAEPEPARPRTDYVAKPGAFDVREFMSSTYPGVEAKSVSDGVRWDIECPWKHEHSSDSGERQTSVFGYSSGAYEFRCLHTHCIDRRHDEFRKFHDPQWVPFAERLDVPAVSQANHNIASTPSDPWQAELDRALADVQAKLTAKTAQDRPPLFGDATALLAEHFDGAAWLVTGLILKLGTAVIGGEPKTTKTWDAIEFGLAVATGTKAFGEFYAERGVVVHFCAEDTKQQNRNRLRALLAGTGRTLAPGSYYIESRGRFLDVLRDEDLAWIIASCRRLGQITLLTLDPLRDVHSGEEDKSDSMRDVMRRLRVLGELLGCTVLVVHHTAKANETSSKRRPGQRLRGSGAIHGSVDSGFYLGGVGGDGRNLFRNFVDSEVKGARSAGRFQLELAIEDDDQGEAVKATWTMRRDVGLTEITTTGDTLAAKIIRTARANPEGYESRTALYKDVGGNKQEVMLAIGALITSGDLGYRNGRIHVTEGA